MMIRIVNDILKQNLFKKIKYNIIEEIIKNASNQFLWCK
jgi:hypothetical protein